MPCDRPRSEARFERVVVSGSRGDQAAIDELLEVLRPRLALYCRSLLRDTDQVPQVLQRALDDVVSALPGMRERRAPFPSWAYGLAAQRVRLANGEGDVDVTRGLASQLSDQWRAVVVGLARGHTIEQVASSVHLSPGLAHVMWLRAMSKLCRVSGDTRGLATIKIVGELLREGDGAAETEEDRGEEGELDLRAARAALLADLRATLRNHDVVSSLDVADAEERAATTAASSASWGAGTVP